MPLIIPSEIAALNDVLKASWQYARELRDCAQVDRARSVERLIERATEAEELADSLRTLVEDHGFLPVAEPTVEEIDLLKAAFAELRGGLSDDAEEAVRMRCDWAEQRLVETVKDALSEESLPREAASLLLAFIRDRKGRRAWP